MGGDVQTERHGRKLNEGRVPSGSRRPCRHSPTFHSTVPWRIAFYQTPLMVVGLASLSE